MEQKITEKKHSMQTKKGEKKKSFKTIRIFKINMGLVIQTELYTCNKNKTKFYIQQNKHKQSATFT